MAQKTPAAMVLREDGAAVPAVAPTTAEASSFFPDLKLGQAIEGGKDQGALEASGKPGCVMKPSLGLVAGSPYAVTSTLSSDTNSAPHPENLPPEATSKGITVTLDNNNMWNEFFRCKTEMILTKQGRRMFPSCRYRISGMEPFQSYLLVMDITPMDSHRYKWSDHRWEPNGKCEPHVSGRVFIHPESPASGHYWMQSPVSFYKLKLTNNVMDQEGHVVLHSMHRYLPRLHIVPADKQTDSIDVNGPDVMTFIFPQTEFFAVTAYQNLSITQLKIDYNPFAKGFREDASNFRNLIPKLGSPSISTEDEHKNNKELGPIKNNLKALFTKRMPVEKSTKEQDTSASKEVVVHCKGSNMQPSVVIEKCIMKRRPSTLSELFQGTPLKLRKTALESSGSSSSVNTQGKLDPKEAPQKSAQEDENLKQKQLPSNVKSKEDSEQASDVSNSLQRSQTLNSGATTGQSCVTRDSGQKVTSISSVDTVVGSSSEEQSQSKSQKRAGAAALPLLALFFQQLKSKPKPVKLAPKSDDSLLSNHFTLQHKPVDIMPEHDSAGSACSSKESSVPASTVFKPNSTLPSESHPQLIDNSNSLTLTPISSKKTVGDTNLHSQSECLTSSKTHDATSGEIFPGTLTSTLSPVTNKPLSTDTLPTTESEEAKAPPLITSATELPGNHPTSNSTSSPLLCEANGSASTPGSPSSPGFSYCSPAPSSDQEPVDHLTNDPLDIPSVTEQAKGDEVTGRVGVASLVIKGTQLSNQLSLGKMPVHKGRPKKGRKRRKSEEPPLFGGPTDVLMQPNLEDVEGQLFVSFTSKKALEVHLGDDADESPPQPQVPKVMEKTVESPEAMAERIALLQKVLIQDLKVMKYKQVIHPVLQEVGLKLNVLDQILAIDLLYLGVELPIPPPSPGASLGIASSQPHFVSRTGKTTDITKIKGWREKFVTPDTKETPSEGGTSSDASLKNRSAFCSDMLDEYLASEGKLIDERAASFSTSSVTPVSYQMPTKSSSYVRTLDSVLKKRAPVSLIPSLKPVPFSSSMSTNSTSSSQMKKPKALPKPKESQKSEASTARRSSRAPAPKATPTATHPPMSTTTTQDTPASKKTLPKVKSISKGPSAVKPLKPETPPAPPSAKKKHSDSAGQTGRSVPPTVAKLLEVEDGAVWAGKERTFVTDERASIALAALACTTGVTWESKAFMPIIKRRAPPCLRVHCRLGCVCASLVQERRDNHCGKPECMLGCHCLRQKVVLLKPKQEELSEASVDSPLSQILTEDEEGSLKTKKKKKKRKKSVSYVLTDPPATSEPATRVRTLWNSTSTEPTQDELHIPSPVYLHCPLLHGTQPDADNDESLMTCARVRPFEPKSSMAPNKEEENISEESTHESGHVDEPEPGEYINGPSKRLEIVSECMWERRTDRMYIMRVLCEHMDKDRLKSPFWIGKYRIQPISQTVVDEGQGPCTNYKVIISQPQLGLLKEKIQTRMESQPPASPGSALKRPSHVQKPASVPRPEQKPAARPQPREDQKPAHVTSPTSEPRPEQEGERVQNPLPFPEQKAEPPPKHRPIEPLPELRPDQGLPFLAGVPSAGLLIAQQKDGGRFPITVNGKAYPKARLQLGHMGALHPANRLAAYIIGKLDPVNLPGYPKPQDEATSIAKSTVTTTASLSSKPTVTMPTVGKVYTQFVVNHLCSQQQKLPCDGGAQMLGSVQKVVLSSNPMVVVSQRIAAPTSPKQQGAGGAKGHVVATLSPSKQAAQKVTVASLTSSVTTTTVTTIATSTTSGGSSGGPPQVQRILKIPPQQQQIVLPSPGIRATAPALIGAKNALGNRILLQPVRTSTGATLYRNSNGQLVQLVPLSQLRNLKPNLVLKDQKAFVRLPSPGILGATPRGPTPSAAPSPLINTSGAPRLSTTPTGSVSVPPVTSTAVTSAGSANTSTPTVDKVMSLNRSTALAVKTTAPSIKGAPEFLRNAGTHTVRIMPASPGNLVKKIVPAGGSFTLLQPPSTKTSVTLGPDKVAVSPVSNKSPLVLVVEKPSALAGIEKLSTDSSVSKPSPVPCLDKPSAVLLVDNSKTASGPVLLVNSATLPLVKTSDVQNVFDNAKVAGQVVPDVIKPSTSMTVSVPVAKDGFSGSDNKSTTVVSSIPGVSLESKNRNCSIPVSDKLAEGSTLDKSRMVTTLSDSATASLQSQQENSVTDTTAASTEGSVDATVEYTSSRDSDLNSLKGSQLRLTNPICALPECDKTSTAEAPKGSSDVSEPSLAFRSNHVQALGITPNSMHCEEIMDLRPLKPSIDKVETIHLDSDDHEDEDCVVVEEKKSAMEEGEIGSDVEVLGDTLVLSDDSDDDSESICVISDSEETENSDDDDDDDDDSVDIETLDESAVAGTNVINRPKSHPIFERARKLEDHKHSERLRRNQMKWSFNTLRHLLNLKDPKTSKICIILEATKQIRHLETQGFYLGNEKDVLIRKQKEYLKKISESSGKSEGAILKKLQDISSRQKQLEEQRKRKKPLAQSPLPKELRISPPIPSEEIEVSTATLATADPECNPPPKPQPPRRPVPTPTSQTPLQAEKRLKIVPNILSKRSKVPSVEPKAAPPPVASAVFSVMNPMLPAQQIISVSNPLHTLVPLASLSSHPTTPGVAAVIVRIPAVPKVIHPTGIQSEVMEKAEENGTSLPKISSVISLGPPVETLDTSNTCTAQEKTLDDSAVCAPPATVSTPTPQNTPELAEGGVPDGPLTTVPELTTDLKASADLEGDEDDEGEDEETSEESTKDSTLTSLLNEIVFLNQQLSGDGSKPSTPDIGLPPEPGEVLEDQPACASLNDERSLSPLFLRLDDEETPVSTPVKAASSKEPHTDTVEPVGEAVESEPTVTAVVPASGLTQPLTPAPALSLTTAGQSQPVASSAVKGDALVPPPLLQMKAGSVAPPVTQSLKENVSWRPMPRLVPLGLKTTPQTLGRGTGTTQ